MSQSTEHKLNIPANAEQHTAITRLLNLIAYAEDTLDWALFESCYTWTQPLQIELSSHISSFAQTLTMTPTDIARTAHTQLAGFDSTQHVVSNVVIDVDASGKHAFARAYSNSFHEFKRPATEGPSGLLIRGMWNMNCIRESNGEWKVSKVKITRLAASEGDEKLYDLAKQKAEDGKGRPALSMWKE